MKICFSVNNPKIDKRKMNRGEDAPPVNKDGIMVICDGTGATGQAEHTIMGEVYTSAYLGSRQTSKIATDFLSRNYEQLINSFSDIDSLRKAVTKLGETIRKDLADYVDKNELTLTVHGKSFKLLPTTFTAVVYKACEEKIHAIVLSAGDSRALWWDADGLHQLSVEDSDNKTLSVGDCSVSNCISADGDFQISFSCYELPSKGILLATPDGFTDPIKPFDQERYLIEWMGNFDNICEQNSHQLSEEISRKMDEIGFTRRDDCSIAGAILGYSSEEELKDAFRKRYKSQLVEPYLKPYKELSSRYKETEAELTEAEMALYKSEKQMVAIIKNGILHYLKSHRDTYDLKDDALFLTLIHADVISSEIGKESNLIDNELREKKRRCTETESQLKTGYLEFLMLLCRDFGEVRFSDELIAAVQRYYETRDVLQSCSQNINSELSALKRLNTDAEICSYSFLDDLSTTLEKLCTHVKRAKNDYQEYEKNAEIVKWYFSYQNEEVMQFYQEDLQNKFAVLKKTSKFPLFASKKRSALKALCQSLLHLHETTQTLKKQTADTYIQSRKAAAYTKTVMRFCEEVARELFHKDKYWDFMPEDLDEAKIPQLNCYKQLKIDLQSLITQRKNLEDLYGKQYEQYLLNASVQGKIMFGNEGYSEYGNN